MPQVWEDQACLRGAKNLGCVQTFDYVKNNLKTGWQQHEYTLAVDNVLF